VQFSVCRAVVKYGRPSSVVRRVGGLDGEYSIEATGRAARGRAGVEALDANEGEEVIDGIIEYGSNGDEGVASSSGSRGKTARGGPKL
jgi:hypothetical protein